MTHTIERSFAGRTMKLETGRLAKQAAGSVLAQFGETVVLAAVTVSDKRSSLPFFPLTVEYRKKTYAAGKFPGGFIKREGRPSDDEILTARVIDRSIRPLFPKGFQNEVQVFVYVLSHDQVNDADAISLLAATAALSISKAPWNGPIVAVRMGRVEGELVVNPTLQQLEESDLDLIISGSRGSIVMVEGSALELAESDILNALNTAHEGMQPLLDMVEELCSNAGQPDMEWTQPEIPAELEERVTGLAGDRIRKALNFPEKTERAQALAAVKETVKAELEEEFPDGGGDISSVLGGLEYAAMRQQVLDHAERIDGRDLDTVRPIDCEVGILPRTHGSALFTRGQTQALVSTTLGTVRDEQRIDNIDMPQETTKSFMLHYNFPPFSVGEVRPVRGVSRREIGHGILAERALQALLPPYDEFPYTIRIVSEILESNGSSSMATVCGGALSLMDAGVPLKAPCAGVAMGLVKSDDKVAILTDILGLEDHLGDMDFKVAGTAAGITAIQMDIKLESGLDVETLSAAMEKARQARIHILEVMHETMPAPRSELSQHAPRIMTIQVNPQKIGDIIGPKGKTIRGIQEETGAEINIDDSGVVTVAAVDGRAGDRAREMIEALVQEPEVGRIYEGVVKSTTNFGAFVEILPGREGLLHISELQHARTDRTEDVVNKGDVVRVKLLELDDRGKMRLSRKALLEK